MNGTTQCVFHRDHPIHMGVFFDRFEDRVEGGAGFGFRIRTEDLPCRALTEGAMFSLEGDNSIAHASEVYHGFDEGATAEAPSSE